MADETALDRRSPTLGAALLTSLAAASIAIDHQSQRQNATPGRTNAVICFISGGTAKLIEAPVAEPYHE